MFDHLIDGCARAGHVRAWSSTGSEQPARFSQATGSSVDGLPGDAAEAMRAPLPAVAAAGSWSANCGNCTGGADALEQLPPWDREAFRQHCLDCGFRSAADWAAVRS